MKLNSVLHLQLHQTFEFISKHYITFAWKFPRNVCLYLRYHYLSGIRLRRLLMTKTCLKLETAFVGFFTHDWVLPLRWCRQLEMFLWIAALLVCNGRILSFLCTILSNTVSLLPCCNYKLKGRYPLSSRHLGLQHEHHVTPLIYLENG